MRLRGLVERTLEPVAVDVAGPFIGDAAAAAGMRPFIWQNFHIRRPFYPKNMYENIETWNVDLCKNWDLSEQWDDHWGLTESSAVSRILRKQTAPGLIMSIPVMYIPVCRYLTYRLEMGGGGGVTVRANLGKKYKRFGSLQLRLHNTP
jgi:hypothetical protein